MGRDKLRQPNGRIDKKNSERERERFNDKVMSVDNYEK